MGPTIDVLEPVDVTGKIETGRLDVLGKKTSGVR